MKYHETVTLKDGRTCVIRSGGEADGQAVLDVFIKTHEQTDFLRTYPDEIRFSAKDEAAFLKAKTESETEIELVAELDGKIVGTAGISAVGTCQKLRHRAEFGISIDKAFWGLGLGRALTRACVLCAERAGYRQLELDAVAENERAITLYQSEGFLEFGRNPRGFRNRSGAWQELVLMRLELNGSTDDPSETKGV